MASPQHKGPKTLNPRLAKFMASPPLSLHSLYIPSLIHCVMSTPPLDLASDRIIGTTKAFLPPSDKIIPKSHQKPVSGIMKMLFKGLAKLLGGGGAMGTTERIQDRSGLGFDHGSASSLGYGWD